MMFGLGVQPGAGSITVIGGHLIVLSRARSAVVLRPTRAALVVSPGAQRRVSVTGATRRLVVLSRTGATISVGGCPCP